MYTQHVHKHCASPMFQLVLVNSTLLSQAAMATAKPANQPHCEDPAKAFGTAPAFYSIWIWQVKSCSIYIAVTGVDASNLASTL